MKNLAKHSVFLFLFFFIFLHAGNCKAQSTVTKVQSLYIYNFAKYIKWANQGSELKIGIYASDNVFKELSKVLSVRKVGASSIKVIRLSDAGQATGHHIVFVGQDKNNIFKKIMETGNTKNMLLITEVDQIKKGASVSFILQNSKLKFRINKEACEKSGLVVSNNLVSLGV